MARHRCARGVDDKHMLADSFYVRHMRAFVPLRYMSFDNRSTAMRTLLAVRDMQRIANPDWVRTASAPFLAPTIASITEHRRVRRIVPTG